MKHPRTYKWLFAAVVIVILHSPLLYWSTGIGQAASELSAEIIRQPNGALASSPKAEALHSLSLPMRLERMFIYPLLLLTFQLSGGALALRRRLERWVQPSPSGQPAPPVRALSWMGRLMPRAWRTRLSWLDLLVIFLFVVIFEAGLGLLYLPFNFYASFIVGHQFGLSTQTAIGWAGDWAKGLAIGLALNGLLWTGFYGLMRLLPRRWPIPGGALMIIVSLVLVLLFPILVTPLFYEVRPLVDADLQARIIRLAGRAGMQVETVEVIGASAKTTQVNAYFTGFGGAQRIVLYDTLLANYTPDEIEVVLAHEMGHWYYHHVLIGIVGMGAASWLGLFGLRWLLQRTWRPLGLAGPADVAGLPYILLIATVVSLFTLPFENGISRYAERQADQFALATSQKPAVFIEFFEKVAVQNLARIDPPAWEKVLFYTHPSLIERMGMAEKFAGLENGEEKAEPDGVKPSGFQSKDRRVCCLFLWSPAGAAEEYSSLFNDEEGNYVKEEKE